MKHLYCLFLLLCLTCLLWTEAAITPKLSRALEAAHTEPVPVHLCLHKHFYPAGNMQRDQACRAMSSWTQAQQQPVLDAIAALPTPRFSRDLQPLWIANVITGKFTAGEIAQLAILPQIKCIDLDETRQLLPTASPSRQVVWNIDRIAADQVWDAGYTGHGITVAVLDTGVNYQHIDLADHLWQHPDFPYPGYDFFNNDPDPMDDNGHGTHCAGTVAGDGSAGTNTGVAPDATIMALKFLGAYGQGTQSDAWQAIQFAVEHGAHVLSMSIGWLHDWEPNRPVWRQIMENLLSLNCTACVAAGNWGEFTPEYPVPDNINTPADCPPPWLHPSQTISGGTSATIAVAASDGVDSAAAFSSHGPVTWQYQNDYNDYPYGPQQGLIRPDVAAPGVGITSLDFSCNAGYLDGWDGTSMATPAVAGTVALMLSKNALLTVAEIDEILETTAVGTGVKDNLLGSGRIDACAAVNAVSANSAAPAPPVLTFPAPAQDSLSTALTLHWLPAANATSYRVYAGTAAAPGCILNGETTDTCWYTLPQLSYGTACQWRIEAVNDFGFSSSIIQQFSTMAPPVESFESGQFAVLNWHHGSNPWQIVAGGYDGAWCARSAAIGPNEESILQLTTNSSTAQECSFALCTSTEAEWDLLSFSIDGSIAGSYSGITAWQNISFMLDAGEHQLQWCYSKDADGNCGEDAVWIDYLCGEALTHTSGTPCLPTLVVHQPYPNPARKSLLRSSSLLSISYDLPRDAVVSASMYNVRGQKVCTLLQQKLPSGSHILHWNGADASGKPVASGLYFCKLTTLNQTALTKCIILQ